ncbi:MAG: YbhB/YbcL family Raf kinase inhibitor-like protein [Alphaproteobacteria bacterium]|nr:YbhB/YbcL family Raf kinase inhibitor-like protein [Alphaproteobacteria bacterium]
MITHTADAMRIDSASVKNNANMSLMYVNSRCGGSNVSPDLQWRGVPSDAKSLALIMHDVDAKKSGGFYHWIVVDIPPSSRGIAAGSNFPAPARELATDFGVAGYGGPCPPVGDNAHRYNFTLYALDIEKIDLSDARSPAATAEIIRSRAIASTMISGLFATK